MNKTKGERFWAAASRYAIEADLCGVVSKYLGVFAHKRCWLGNRCWDYAYMKKSPEQVDALKFVHAVAPTRCDIVKFIQEKGIELIFDEDTHARKFEAHSFENEPVVRIPIKPFPHLLTQIDACLRAFSLLSESQNLDFRCAFQQAHDSEEIKDFVRQFENGAIDDIKASDTLLSTEEDLTEHTIHDDDDIGALAADIAVMAYGVILLHELAHLEPKALEDAYCEEFRADECAVNFLLSQARTYAKSEKVELKLVLKKMYLAIVAAFIWIGPSGRYLSSAASETHPPSLERLGCVLMRDFRRADKLACYVAATFLLLHESLEKDNTSPQDSPNHTQSLIDYLLNP